MEINKVFCLFEQSGTFKNEFKKLGIDAEDFDILNDYGETDRQIDLYKEIDKAFDGKESIFDDIKPEDLVMAFYPCTRFECQAHMLYRGESAQMQNWTDEQKLVYSMKCHEELHALYMRLCKLCLISIRGGYKLIIENPVTQPHYLTSFFPIKPKIIDKDRRENGDFYRKPTQYFFINCDPEDNLVFEPMDYTPTRIIEWIKGSDRQRQRSEISPQYARRFIKRHIKGTYDEHYTRQ